MGFIPRINRFCARVHDKNRVQLSCTQKQCPVTSVVLYFGLVMGRVLRRHNEPIKRFAPRDEPVIGPTESQPFVFYLESIVIY